jgi:hypothetical protein
MDAFTRSATSAATRRLRRRARSAGSLTVFAYSPCRHARLEQAVRFALPLAVEHRSLFATDRIADTGFPDADVAVALIFLL